MSVVTTWEAVPNRIEAVVQYLSHQKSVSKAELSEVLSPSSIGGRNVVPRVIAEALNLSLIQQTEGERWSLAEELQVATEVRLHIARTLLDPHLAASAKQSRVAPAMAWFLTRDVREPLSVSDNWRTLVERDCPSSTDAFELSNSSSCQQFAYWAVYLGLGWKLATGVRETGVREVLVPDPTTALEYALRVAVDPGETLSVEDAIARIADICPVIEGGSVREDVERQLVPTRRRPAGQLSRSTSFALARLEAKGVIEMPPPPSDALVMMLDLWPKHRRVSQLRVSGSRL